MKPTHIHPHSLSFFFFLFFSVTKLMIVSVILPVYGHRVICHEGKCMVKYSL